MEVVYEGIRLTPERIVNAALEESVHVVGLSILSGGHVSLVGEVLAGLDADIRDRHADVAVERPLPDVTGHRLILAQVGTNLMTNALKFAAPGAPPRVRIRSERRGNRVRLWVEDDGIGVAPEHHDRIFQVFQRLHGPDEYPGTGIGLAIVRRAVERLGGRAGVESEEGRGSRFWVELPAAEGES
jgi:signal transduction histidine kinase